MIIYLIIIAALSMLAPPAKAQIMPFVQGGTWMPSKESGYTKPSPFVEPGIEFDNRCVTIINWFDYSPAVSKGSVLGIGYSLGGQSANYFRIAPGISLGGGVSAINLRTPIWTKSNVSAFGGAMFDSKHGRLFFDYSHAVALDQNRRQEAKGAIEI